VGIFSLAPPRWIAIVILAWHERTPVIGSLVPIESDVVERSVLW